MLVLDIQSLLLSLHSTSIIFFAKIEKKTLVDILLYFQWLLSFDVFFSLYVVLFLLTFCHSYAQLYVLLLQWSTLCVFYLVNFFINSYFSLTVEWVSAVSSSEILLLLQLLIGAFTSIIFDFKCCCYDVISFTYVCISFSFTSLGFYHC